jgi:hypothetical protein
MIELKKDRMSRTWIITKTDNEGFHRQLNATAEELDELVRLWQIQKESNCADGAA